jgi:hypothetical protein
MHRYVHSEEGCSRMQSTAPYQQPAHSIFEHLPVVAYVSFHTCLHQLHPIHQSIHQGLHAEMSLHVAAAIPDTPDRIEGYI